MRTYAAALAEARTALAGAGIASAALDARLLMAAAAGLDTAALIARANENLPALAEGRFDAHLKRRIAGEPVARILGEKEFWGLPFEVNAATLVPRPDTETLVQAVLTEARSRFDGTFTICDLGTGSGAIVIALLSELPDARGVATDISEAALATARRNAERLGVAAQISFHAVDFAKGPDGPFDVVVSNPPYIPSGAIESLAAEVKDYDPHAALDGGPDGLGAYRAILARADTLVAKGGLMALEVGYDQSESVAALCRANGLGDVTIRHDLAGIGRVVVAHAAGTQTDKRKAAKKALGKVWISG